MTPLHFRSLGDRKSLAVKSTGRIQRFLSVLAQNVWRSTFSAIKPTTGRILWYCVRNGDCIGSIYLLHSVLAHRYRDVGSSGPTAYTSAMTGRRAALVPDSNTMLNFLRVNRLHPLG